MRERRTRRLRVCRRKKEEKEVLASGKGEGKREVVSVCLHALRVRIAREQGTGKSVRGERRGERECGGSVLSDTSWRGERGVVRGEGKGVKKKKKVIWGGFQGRTSCQGEGQRCEESPGTREHAGEEDISCRRNIRRPFKT